MNEQLAPTKYYIQRLDLDGKWWMATNYENCYDVEKAEHQIIMDKQWRTDMNYPPMQYRIMKLAEEVVKTIYY